MTPEERDPKVHHQTARGARLALARKEISQESYRAVLASEITLRQAKELGRDRGPDGAGRASGGREETRTGSRSASAEDGADRPPQPVSRISKDDRSRACMCGCGRATAGVFAQGHDMRMFQVAREHLTEGRELTEEQREYLEVSGKLEHVRARIAEGDGKRQENR